MIPFLIVGNWKMNKTIKEAVEFAGRLSLEIKERPGRKVAVAPPFTALSAVAEALQGTGIGLAAQDVCDREEGAYTGEVSARMLADAGCRYVIVGHSERRTFFREDDALINGKLKVALRYGLQPILCIGETLAERQENRTLAVVAGQLQKGFAGLDVAVAARVVVAYEPVWAIGTGQTASPEAAAAVHIYIRERAGGIYGADFSHGLPIIYGGSVNPANIRALMAQPDINGVLVGGASLEVESFTGIAEF